ncbi:ras-related protein Rab-18-like isoform X2 [Malaclemys terrapin pileata]|uniref:ras-related protein Rab-18-like isoform X2 n=1 Tax=Malaclemys terrapin pileata TaxID=2991368 RepID=UPI0023A911F1|nr:ras-related protein Rab-18-like isoform X2 [Malaclemys terrapin pileata]
MATPCSPHSYSAALGRALLLSPHGRGAEPDRRGGDQLVLPAAGHTRVTVSRKAARPAGQGGFFLVPLPPLPENRASSLSRPSAPGEDPAAPGTGSRCRVRLPLRVPGTLLLRFTDDTFEPYLNPTIGVDFKVKKMVVDGNPVQLAIWPDREINKREGLQFARKHSMLFIETSAKTRDGVQCAFEEVVIKILQTPGLWDKDKQKFGVQLETATHTEEDFCGGYCTLT